MSALELLDQWPVSHAAAGWITASGSTDTWGSSPRPFLLASVTKPLVALAVLVAVEEGTLALDSPAGPPGATIRDLLSHSSGLGPAGEVLAAPRTRRIYSNHGYELLGFALQEASEMPTATYLDEAIVKPLGFTATSLAGSPAHGGISSVEDLLAIARELMHPTLLAPETVAEMTSPVHAELTGVLPGFGRQDPNPWGLGFEIRGDKSPHWTGAGNSPATYGHFGQAGTFIWVDPEAKIACVALTDEPFGPWATEHWPNLSDAVLHQHS